MPSIRVEPVLIRGRLKATSPHAFSPRSFTTERERDAGERRIRPDRRPPPFQLLQGEYYFSSQAQFDAFWDWYEDELLAGAEDFDVLVAGQGGVVPVWWTARHLEVPRYVARRGLRWGVEVQLLLLDEIGTERVEPGLDAAGRLVFDGEAMPDAPGARAEGAIVFGGYAVAVLPDLYAMGSVEFGGHVVTDGEAAGADDDLMRVWMGLDLEPPVMDDQDALTAQAMGY